jgi:hypothetical protein
MSGGSQDSFQFFAHFPEGEAGSIFSPGNHDIRGGGEYFLIQPEEFAEPPFQAIAFDRPSDPFADRDPQARMGQGVRANGHPKMAALIFCSFAPDPQKIRPVSNPLLFPELVKTRLCLGVIHRARWVLVVADVHDQTLAALGPPAFQHQTTAFGGHPTQKPMCPLPFNIAGLIGPLHRFFLA